MSSGSTYGTVEWLNREYAKVEDDPWGLSWRPSQQLRYQRVLKSINARDLTLENVLDIGCATGDFTSLLAAHLGPERSILGVDCVETAIDRARRRFPGLEFRTESLAELGSVYAGQFDLATCLEVIYYVPKEQQLAAVRSVRRSLRPGGLAVFSSFLSTAPHFSREQFVALLEREFRVQHVDVLHLRALNLIEKVGTKIDDRILRLGRRFGKVSAAAAWAIEKLSRKIGTITASHAIVLARNSE